MGILVKLHLVLLCFETAFTLQCVLCHLYKNQECVHGKQMCIAQPHETCMICRTWYGPESECMLCDL
ncbi:hypothetical protein LEMLEM_LOCUS23165 [Lemmus lemmus]